MSTTVTGGTPILAEAEKFDGNNWFSWKMKIIEIARSRGVQGYLDGTIQEPSPSAANPSATTAPPTLWFSKTPSPDEWTQRDNFARALIVLNVINPIGLGVDLGEDQMGSAHRAWKSLVDVHGKLNKLAKMNAENDLRRITYTDGADVRTHVAELRLKWRKANDLGSTIDDETFRTILLSSMPMRSVGSWDAIISVLINSATTTEVVNGLIMHGDRINAPANPLATTSALQARTTRPRSTEVCTNCKKTGHAFEKCFQPGGGQEGQYPDWWRGKKAAPAAKLAATTQNLVSTNQTDATASYVLSAQAPTALGERSTSSVTVLTAQAPQTGNLALNDPTKTYADSGASDHFFKDKGTFATYEKLPATQGLSAKEGASFTIIGRGTVRKDILCDGRKFTLEFKNALHSPDIRSNLVSVSSFDIGGFYVTFGGGKVVFKDSHGVSVMVGAGTHGMYELDGFDASTPPANALTARPSAAASIDVWHRRFGHAGTNTIKQLAARGLVNGLEISGEDSLPGQCEVCIMGKQTRLPFNEPVTPESGILDRIHIDLTGPMRVKSNGGKEYMIGFSDGASSVKKAYFLENKEAGTTTAALKDYKTWAEKQTGRTIKTVRTDGGTEFKGEFEAFLKAEGINHETTSPYSSAANGVAERFNRTTFDDLRCMLEDSKLPPSFWAEAAAMSIHIRNLIPSSRHPGRVPLETWTGKRQGVGHLHPFGCTCYAKIPAELGTSKLETRSIKARLIGYAGHLTYRLWDPNTRRIFNSRDIIFEEGQGRRTITNDDTPMPDDRDLSQATPVSLEKTVSKETVANGEIGVTLNIAPTTNEDEIPRRSARARIPMSGPRNPCFFFFSTHV